MMIIILYSTLHTDSSMYKHFFDRPVKPIISSLRFQVPIPNTRHNAVFLRDNPKAAQVILKSPYHNGEYIRTENKGDSNEDHKGNLPLKKVSNLAQKPNTKMELETDADRWAGISANDRKTPPKYL